MATNWGNLNNPCSMILAKQIYEGFAETVGFPIIDGADGEFGLIGVGTPGIIVG